MAKNVKQFFNPLDEITPFQVQLGQLSKGGLPFKIKKFT